MPCFGKMLNLIAVENFNAVCDVEMLVPEIIKNLPRKTRGIAPARFSDNVEAGPSSTPLAGPFFQKIVRRNMHKAPLVRGVVVHLVVGRGWVRSLRVAWW